MLFDSIIVDKKKLFSSQWWVFNELERLKEMESNWIVVIIDRNDMLDTHLWDLRSSLKLNALVIFWSL
jgi:hypothetical protein